MGCKIQYIYIADHDIGVVGGLPTRKALNDKYVFNLFWYNTIRLNLANSIF